MFSTLEQVGWVEHGCRTAEIGCLECKRVLADNIINALVPIQDRYAEITKDLGFVHKVIKDGAEHARDIAQAVMADVRGALGLYIG